MSDDEPRVWVMRRPTKGKTTYHLRWVCPETHRWKSRKTGTDGRRAEREAMKLQEALEQGTYQATVRIGWASFVEDHVAKISGAANAREAKHALEEFGAMMAPSRPNRVTFTMIERYAARLRDAEKPVSNATIAKKLRYLRAALNAAIKRGYAAKNPVTTDLFPAVERKVPRVCTNEEEVALLDAAETLYGIQWRAFIIAALGTGARRGELLALMWGRVTFGDEPEIHFTKTKSHRDRIVPIAPETADVLQRLKVQTLVAGGPFIGMGDNVWRCWTRIVHAAGVSAISIHDLRRTYCTRLIRAGVDLPAVQRLMGHANIQTTIQHYNWTSRSDLRRAVAKLRRHA